MSYPQHPIFKEIDAEFARIGLSKKEAWTALLKAHGPLKPNHLVEVNPWGLLSVLRALPDHAGPAEFVKAYDASKNTAPNT
jgi:hypothetical protein